MKEKIINPASGITALVLQIILFLVALVGFISSIIALSNNQPYEGLWIATVIVTSIVAFVLFPILLLGLKVVNPNEAAVFTLFGKYYGTIVSPGFFFINPFCTLANPTVKTPTASAVAAGTTAYTAPSKKVSMKAITLNNEKQKINDREGNPIEVGVVVIWKVVNATKAVFEVDNYKEYVSTQADAAIRHVARQYPYDISQDGEEASLRGSSGEVSDELRRDLQNRVDIAGIEILETRIAHLAYAQEIASAMLQRQQADAIIAARQKIVEGAVGMVETALARLAENKTVALDEERKAAMVSNLLVVLCGNRDAQPIVNSGSLY
ncbi:MAG: SPFH domain-containing protein [Clostridiales bacterium]|jgi:regulator of protease activity HflC (stomatin/prohibitin superfamily)|nr:SPFH domain-containing protein [Clostridiales bacterium]